MADPCVDGERERQELVMKDLTDSILQNIPPHTGKSIRNSLWVHSSVLEPDALASLQELVRTEHLVPLNDLVIRIDRRTGRIAHLHYPRFFEDAHPALCCSVLIDAGAETTRLQSFETHTNRLILHRKELLVTRNHEAYTTFAALTAMEERLGLLDEKRRIGWSIYWQELLRNRGLTIEGHEILEHRTAD